MVRRAFRAVSVARRVRERGVCQLYGDYRAQPDVVFAVWHRLVIGVDCEVSLELTRLEAVIVETDEYGTVIEDLASVAYSGPGCCEEYCSSGFCREPEVEVYAVHFNGQSVSVREDEAKSEV